MLEGNGLSAGATVKKKNIFQKAAETVKKTVEKTVNPIVKKPNQGGGTQPKKTFIKKAAQAAKDIVNAGIRFNPLIAASRNGLLLFFMIVTKISKLLYPAIKYQSEAEAAKDGIDAAQFKKSKDGLQRVEQMFVKNMQGKAEALHKAITKGATKGKNGMKGFGSFTEEYLSVISDSGDNGIYGALGEVATAAVASTVSLPPIIATIVEMVKAGLVNIKPDQIKDFAQGLMKEANESPEVQEVGEAMQTEANYREGATADGGSGENTASTGGVMDWIKENPVKTGLGVGALILGGWAANKYILNPDEGDKAKPKQEPKEKPLSGTRSKRKRTQKQQDSFQLY